MMTVRPITASLATACFVFATSPACFASDRFNRIALSEEFHSEGAAVADVDGDGHRDVVSGPFWYEGPEFRRRHAYAPVKPYSTKGYSDHFFTFARDFNDDSHIDILSIPIPGGRALWYENPGVRGMIWKSHIVLDGVGNESPTLTDITGDGEDDLVCIRDGQFGYAEPNRDDPDAAWTFTAISEKRGYGRFTHGLGVGDVDGDGKPDLLEKDGWWQQTGAPGEPFKFHATKFAESGGSQMFAYDFDGDGDNDVVSVQNAHGFGLCWFERRGTGDDYLFVRHVILGNEPDENPYGLAISQMHALALVDVDKDGVKDLVTGKRYWAHGGADPGADQLPVLYWLRTVRSTSGVRFEPHLISRRVGVGTQLTVDDVDGNGHVDVVVGNKLGTYVLLNSGRGEPAPLPTTRVRHLAGTDEFKTHIRTTEPLTPDQERATFVLPAGFEAQLVAAEPEIAKPMNMAFDSSGRLWVTSSVEYPFPAPEGKGRDTIKILEDTDGDGRAEKVTTFADGLNIPMGLYPYGDGVICYSIPNIWFLRDTDGDDKADVRQVLYGPFDASRDTHGMCNAFTRGYDGWLYACHGFNNQSAVTGKDGHQVTMHSGNTFRMRVDGSRIEHFTHGQVNPFGMAVDPAGDFFTADCHTKPVTLLLRGGFYESFGKPHDGVGFVPDVMQHLHGSTAIGGIALYHGEDFPSIYHGNAFGGNVMTSRVNRNSIHHNGSSIRAHEESDFLISGDPWFRPVDLQVGPDGALYVADFYNRIIGHYEVDLNHPGRDRHRGRIWRIVFNDPDARRDTAAHARRSTVAATDDLSTVVSQLASRNLTARMIATDRLVDHFGLDAVDPLRDALQQPNGANVRVHALWALHRLGALTADELKAAAGDSDARVRGHAFQVIAATGTDAMPVEELLVSGLADSDPQVLRHVVMATTEHRSQAFIPRLLNLLHNAPEGDVHLRHAIRMSLRDHLMNGTWFKALTTSLEPADEAVIVDLCVALKTDVAGEFLAKRVGTLKGLERQKLSEYLTFAARYAAAEYLSPIVEMAERRFGEDLDYQADLVRSVAEGLQQRGSQPPPVVNEWAARIAREYLGMSESDDELSDTARGIAWTYLPHPSAPDRGNPWRVSTKRNSADGQESSILFSSFPTGESMTGIYRSDVFELPDRFAFYLAGHDGFPDKPIQRQNFVRLRDARTQEVLQLWSPPRNDTAQPISWETGDAVGRDVVVELVDGDTANAFAWIAVGRFSIEGLNPSRAGEDRRKAARLIADLRLETLRRPMEQLLLRAGAGDGVAVEYARALVALQPTSQRLALAESLSITGVDRELSRQLKSGLLNQPSVATGELLESVMKVATAAEQKRLAEPLASDNVGLETLIALVERGHASARLLVDSAIAPKISAIADEKQTSRIAELVKDISDQDDALVGAMQQRKNAYLAGGGDTSIGAEIFAKQCGICHQVAGKGASVGPNLDGIGNRGLDRLIEDVMMPNRNIDAAFRATVVLTDEGRVISGLAKPTDGAQLIVVDPKGKEIAIPLGSIVSRKTVATSPMPGNIHDTLDDAGMRNLLAYLLSLTR